MIFPCVFVISLSKPWQNDKKSRSKWSKASSLFVAEVVLFLGALHIFAFPSNPVTPKPEKKEWALQMSAEGW